MNAAASDPSHPFFLYTSEILSWRLGQRHGTTADAPTDPAETALRVSRLCRSAARYAGVVLLGLGSGALATALARDLPPDTSLTVVTTDPEAARDLADRNALPWRTPSGNRQLLADTSEQALACLLAATGLTVASYLLTLNPEPLSEAERHSLGRVRHLLAACRPAPPPEGVPGPLTLAVLARPEEPGLEAFFQAVTGLADRAVLLWDAATVPPAAAKAASLAIPVTHLARPLDHDFAAQRNALLAACPPGWVLTLDPDERPGPGFAQTLPLAMATPGLGGVSFPRLTIHPGTRGVMAGYGLWPDLQLRLLRHIPPDGPRYVRPVHERLERLAGPMALALGAPIEHLNRLVADDGFVTAKLRAFSAIPNAPQHRLNADYPNLPRSFFTGLAAKTLCPPLLLLPSA